MSNFLDSDEDSSDEDAFAKFSTRKKLERKNCSKKKVLPKCSTNSVRKVEIDESVKDDDSENDILDSSISLEEIKKRYRGSVRKCPKKVDSEPSSSEEEKSKNDYDLEDSFINDDVEGSSGSPSQDSDEETFTESDDSSEISSRF